MEQLSGLDSALVQGDLPNSPLHIGALFIYDPSSSPSGTLSYEDVRNLVTGIINTSLPILKCRPQTIPLMLDKPYWIEEPNFNLDFHVERYALPKPDNWATLHEIAARFHAMPLNMERPLWQALFLEGLDHLQGIPKGSVGLVFKIHHALADGKTAMKLFAALHSLSAEPDAPMILQKKDIKAPDFTPPGLLKTWGRTYWHTITAPAKLTKDIVGILPAFLSRESNSPAQKALPDTTPAPPSPFNTAPSADRIIGHIRLPMQQLEALQKASSCTINDIALCIIAGGLRDYLKEQGELPENSLMAGMPIDIRAKDEKKSIGNQISIVRVSLHTEMPDARKRLETIHAASSASRKKNSKVGAGSLMSIIDHLHPGLLVWAARLVLTTGLTDRMPNVINTITTNVPGVPLPCYLCGAKLVDYIGFGPLPPTLSLFHVISSIHSHVNISFQACSRSLKDPDAYTKALERSTQEIMGAYFVTENSSD